MKLLVLTAILIMDLRLRVSRTEAMLAVSSVGCWSGEVSSLLLSLLRWEASPDT